MSSNAWYPDEPAGPFPSAPRELTDRADRAITIQRADAVPDVEERLVQFYETFEPADRAQGIPPARTPQIEEWVRLICRSGPDVVGLHEDRIVAHATLVPDDTDAYELAIFVAHDYQGAGIGTSVLRTLLGTAAAEGIEHVWLTVERWNTPAIRLYDAVGFERRENGSFELEMAIRLETSGP